MIRITAELMPIGMGSFKFVELMPFGTGSIAELVAVGTVSG